VSSSVDAPTSSAGWLAEGPPVDGPVGVQPHGVLLAARASDLVITHVSQNSLENLALEARPLLGLGLDAVFGEEWVEQNRGVLGAGTTPHTLAASIDGRAFDVIVHHSGASVVLELESAADGPEHEAALAVYRAIHRLTLPTSDRELWDTAALALRELTGVDRVMVYQLHPDGHGEIVAEEAADGMERFLGLRFPASDFPGEIREAYLRRRSRVIVSSTALSSVVIDDGAEDAVPLDLSGAELRSVSAHDAYFMRALGHASILSLSLVRGGELIGVISLAGRESRVIPYSIRQGLEALANQVALQQGSMAEIERLTESMRLRAIRMELTDRLVLRRSTDASAIAGALLDGDLTVLDLIPADGAMICLGTHSTAIGTTPQPSMVRAAVLQLGATLAGRSIATGSLAQDRPDVAELLPGVSGLIVTPLPGFDGFLAWFRTATPQKSSWFGAEPGGAGGDPGTSYPSWSQTTSDRSIPWAGLEAEADDLARDLTVAMLQEADTQLAALAMRDALTGLPNRRLLMDRIELSLATESGTAGQTVMFVDLDAFKAVNDTHGHDAGDALLVNIANRILATTRGPDTVARLGGDEFVVFCDGIGSEEAAAIAERITEAIRQPVDLGGQTLSITASVGLAAAVPGSSAAELLKRADDAMYRAKAQGRDRVSL
jgi:chemotaxis family two-component system sensor kinase Cph1